MDYKFQPKSIQNETHHSAPYVLRRRSGSVDFTAASPEDFYQPPTTKRWFESGSTASVHLGSSLKIFHEDEKASNIRKSKSRLKIFDEKGFLGRRTSLIKMNLHSRMNLNQRRNTVA